MIWLAVLTEYRRVTVRQTDGQTSRHGITPRHAYTSRGKHSTLYISKFDG